MKEAKEIQIPPNTTLYFLTQPGCAHCAVTRPIVAQLRSKYLGKLFVYELNAARHPRIGDFEPKATPAFALKVGGMLMAAEEGAMTLTQMEQFVERGAKGGGHEPETATRRRRRRSTRDRRDASGEDRHQGEDNERDRDDGSDNGEHDDPSDVHP